MKEISAEMLLGYLYPELNDRWVVKNEGTFYRTYNEDVMSVNTGTGELQLSRDGFLHLLPDTIISDVSELKGKGMENYEAVMRRKKLLAEAFVPLDTFNFRHRLRIEQKVSALLNEKLAFILKKYFCIDLSAITNAYVRDVVMLLPYVSHKRGDMQFVRLLLKMLLDCEVEMDLSHRYSETDSTIAWIPQVRFNILKSDMTREEYETATQEIQPLVAFLTEWFIPCDMKIRISFRQHNLRLSTNNEKLVLDYNTEL